MTNERHHNLAATRPLRKMRECLQLLRLVTRARRSERLDHAGEPHRLAVWTCQVGPLRPAIPLRPAPTSAGMERPAAEAADGIALGALRSAEVVADVAARCRATAGQDFGVTMASLVGVDAGRNRAREAARAALVNRYAGNPRPAYDALLRREGHAGVADTVDRVVRAGDLVGARRAFPDEVVDRLLIAGTPDECLTPIRAYAAAGVDELLFVGVTGMRYRAGRGTTDARRALFDSYGPPLDLGRRAAAPAGGLS
jgi:alkanesulfonate monooxygenase SsuD/methylene tetrahydromethanopterin reductase-like flavin-dependent oxidoreductase (luciferase family)